MKKKHIVAIGFTVDKNSNNVGGLSMMFELFCTIAKTSGYTVHVISLNSNDSKAKVGFINFKRVFEYLLIVLNVLLLFVRFPKSILYFNPSTAKSGGYRDVLLINLSKLFGYSILMQQFGALFEFYFNSLSSKMQRVLANSYNKAKIIIVEGESAKQQYKFIENKEIIISINNGLPESNNLIQKLGKQLDSEKAFELFYMNNMIESKGYVDVLKAVDILVNNYNLNVHCTFAGRYMSVVDDTIFKNTKEAEDWFNSFVKNHNLENYVTYLNCVFDQEKANCFLKSNVFLLPSYYIYEGQPTAILEALSYGSVPIVTNYRLIPEMVNETCGIFVKAKDPKNIADAVRLLVDDKIKYNILSQNCINIFNDKFTQEKYTDKIKHLLNLNF